MPEVIVLVRLTVGVDRLHVRPEDEVTDSVTVPVKPLIPLTIIVDEPVRVPVGGETVVGLAATVKSTTLTVTVADRDGNPGEAPVTVTTYVPADGKLTVNVAVPEVTLAERVMVVGDTVPALVLSVTVPVNPLRPVTVIVEVA